MKDQRIAAVIIERELKRSGLTLAGLSMFLAVACSAQVDSNNHSRRWSRHTIDDSSRGADGVRLADGNGDGRPDIATGWEEGGITRVYVHPGVTQVREPWPAVTVGKTPNVEDAVWVDLDGDGALDVVSSCEGQERRLFVHWSPLEPSARKMALAWSTEPFRFRMNTETDAAASRAIGESRLISSQQWMFALPLDIDGQNGVDLVVGSKGANASVGWLESPKSPRELSAWRYHHLVDAGWIMTLRGIDMDGDEDLDVLLSDRRGDHSGVWWLENPGPQRRPPFEGSSVERPFTAWPVHEIGGRGIEVLFLDAVVLGGQAPSRTVPNIDIVVAVRPDGLLRFRRVQSSSNDQSSSNGQSTIKGRLSIDRWSTQRIDCPIDFGKPKAVAIGDIDLDGHADLVVSCEAAKNRSGVRWMSAPDGVWQDHEISGLAGVKFDRIELVDLDEDGDLDVLTCEERDNLGVIWYENPQNGDSRSSFHNPRTLPEQDPSCLESSQ